MKEIDLIRSKKIQTYTAVNKQKEFYFITFFGDIAHAKNIKTGYMEVLRLNSDYDKVNIVDYLIKIYKFKAIKKSFNLIDVNFCRCCGCELENSPYSIDYICHKCLFKLTNDDTKLTIDIEKMLDCVGNKEVNLISIDQFFKIFEKVGKEHFREFVMKKTHGKITLGTFRYTSEGLNNTIKRGKFIKQLDHGRMTYSIKLDIFQTYEVLLHEFVHMYHYIQVDQNRLNNEQLTTLLSYSLLKRYTGIALNEHLSYNAYIKNDYVINQEMKELHDDAFPKICEFIESYLK